MKKFISLVIDLFAFIGVVVLGAEIIPNLLSAPNNISVAIGFLMVIFCVAAIWCIFYPVIVKIVEEVKK